MSTNPVVIFTAMLLTLPSFQSNPKFEKSPPNSPRKIKLVTPPILLSMFFKERNIAEVRGSIKSLFSDNKSIELAILAD